MRVTGDKELARTLRRSMSLPEVILWQELRKKPDGLQFRRQHPAGPYVLDFFCAPLNLAVEIDGQAHDFGIRPKRDAIRDAWLNERGIRVLRLQARDVLRDLEAVVKAISQAADAC